MDKITTARSAEENEKSTKKAASKKAFPQIPNSAMIALMSGATPPDDNLRGRRTDLAPILAAKMSAAFGMDVSGVKVYRSNAMAGTGMHGLARGNEIVLASDVDLNTLEGQSVLGHELSHIRAQGMGIGMGNTGLLNNTALEHQADIEGARAARGMDIVQRSMDFGMGINTSFGMQGVENLSPIGAGLGAAAAAPMQASKDDYIPDYDFALEREEQKERDADSKKLVDEEDSLANTDKDTNGEMDGEFESIPLIWERRIPGDPNQAPKAIVSISQGENGFSFGENNGHSMMGLEYSKKSKRSGKKSRYRVDFGFYPKFGSAHIGETIEEGQGATVPGQLMDEKNSEARNSKKYPISYRQAETVADNAQTYEEGGYNFFKRNCTTFVADMTREANINVGGIFQDEKWNLSEKNRSDLNTAQLGGFFRSTTSESKYLNERAKKKDTRVGVNKNLVTERDLENFKTGRVRGGVEAAGYGPSRSGDRMRASEIGEGTGKIGSSIDGVRHALSTNMLHTRLSFLNNKQENFPDSRDENGKYKYKAQYDSLMSIIEKIEKLRKMKAIDSDSANADSIAAYRIFSNQYRNEVIAWLSENNRPEMVMKGAAELALGVLDAADEALMNRYPGFWDRGVSEDEEEDAFTQLLNDPDLIHEDAMDRSFGFKKEGQEQKDIYKGLMKQKAAGNVRVNVRGMQRFYVNIGANENLIKSSLLDMRSHADSRDYDDIQEDLDYVFGDLEKRHYQNGVPNMLDNRMNPANFAYRVQSAELQKLFGDSKLGTGTFSENMVRESHEGLESVVNAKPHYVKMIAKSTAKQMKRDALNPYTLSALVMKRIEYLYCIPQMMKNSSDLKEAPDSSFAAQRTQYDRQFATYADKKSNDDLYAKLAKDRESGDYKSTRDHVNKATRDQLLEICQEVINEMPKKDE